MRDCWHDVPSVRPSFGDLVDDIQRLLNISSGTVRTLLSSTDILLILGPNKKHEVLGLRLLSYALCVGRWRKQLFPLGFFLFYEISE